MVHQNNMLWIVVSLTEKGERKEKGSGACVAQWVECVTLISEL